MRAIRVHNYGGPDVLQLEEIPTPDPQPGQIRVRVEAIGVNFIDIYHRTGAYQSNLPIIPGREAAGIVDALGDDVTVDEIGVGDRVAFAMTPGTYAEYVNIDASLAAPVPDGITASQAAAVMLQGMTAHYLVTDTFKLQQSHTCLIHAAAGGVGHLLVQMAKRRGATVIGTASSDEKIAFAAKAGADHMIKYTESDFLEVTMRFTGNRGVHVVYESVGKDTFMRSMRALRPRGYLVLYGQSSGAVEPLDPQLLNRHGSLFLTRPSLGHYIADRQELLNRAEEIFGWMANGELEVRIDKTYPLADAPDAHRYLEGRNTRGKILLLP